MSEIADDGPLPVWAKEVLRLRDEAERLARLTASIALSSVPLHGLEKDAREMKTTQPL